MNEAKHTPECGSWVVTRKRTGEVIGEFYSRQAVARFSPATCLIETAAQYLARVNGARAGQ